MSISYIKEKTKILLWGMAAGRCQYTGCNKKLYEDDLTKAEFNEAYIAHIVADKPRGPRGDVDLSPKLKDKLSNLMLLCDEHHRLIDKEDVDGHPKERLDKMKAIHESEMERLTAIMPEKRSHMILYGSRIGVHESPLNYLYSSLAMTTNGKYPVSRQPIKLGLANATFEDSNESYWDIQAGQLLNAFNRDVRPLINDHEIQHFSVFGLAPIPLLIKLGTLLSDINSVDLYQKHREPDTWEWQGKADVEDFKLIEPELKDGTPALVFSLSATISNDRVLEVIGKTASIWVLTIDNPNYNFLKTSSLLKKFGRIAHQALNQIKAEHGQDVELHIFPAMPVTSAIEFGRIWMPKADMPMIVYDQNNKTNGFSKALEIRHE